MDREEKEIKEKNLEPFIFDLGEIPEVELMDYDNEETQIIMYSKWDRIKEWLKKIWR